MGGHYERLLESVVEEADRPIWQLPMLGEEERHRLLVEWNDTGMAYPRDQTVHGLFSAQARRTPESVALIYQEQSLSYGELDRRSTLLAHRLRGLGVGPEVLVGLCVERSLEMVVGILGILKAGGAYVPLDPEYPPWRLAYMLEDTSAPVLVLQGRFDALFSEVKATRLDLDGFDWSGPLPEGPLDSGVGADNLVYVMYTSGSTGKPKGVMITQQNLANYVLWAASAYGHDGSASFALCSSLASDLTVTPLYVPLILGSVLRIYPDRTGVPGAAVLEAFREDRVDAIKLTPSQLSLVLESSVATKRIRRLILGGENLSCDLATRAGYGFGAWTEIVNEYGPTEATVGCVINRFSPAYCSGESVPIGRGCAGASLYVLDAQATPVPIGVAGELYIGGVGLARGYLDLADLTAERFVADPFGGERGQRLYRTGDLVRYRSDGNLEFLGRIDHQVKLRGFRIELGEIESVLCQHEAVSSCVVVLRADPQSGDQLVAYVVGDVGSGIPPADLRAHLRNRLPEHMVPTAFVALEQLPLTVNGKLDRDALPDPGIEHRALGAGYVGPRTPVEEALAGIWREVLGIERVGVEDNLFDLGGHSLLAIQILNRVQDVLGVELPLIRLFECPTVSELAALVVSGSGMVRRRRCRCPGVWSARRMYRCPMRSGGCGFWIISAVPMPGTTSRRLMV